jgi:hypothetical protein
MGNNSRAPVKREAVSMKKLPIIGLVIGAIAALFALRKKKGSSVEETPPTGDSPSA